LNEDRLAPPSAREQDPFPWRRVAAEAGLLLGFLLASSWLVGR